MHAEICPVCSGSGNYSEKECHGCNGKGWVMVVGGNPSFPMPVYPEPIRPFKPYYPYWISPVWSESTATPLPMKVQYG